MRVAKENGNKKQGRTHGNPVADGWAGAVMPKPLRFKNVTDGPPH